ncbi:MAG: hypothetical protein HZB21_00435 [Deltaproteobacteria bacterium]|nr:hypothetical protein [Deltaproteobacteria bacterium]MBI5809651.1 hypothetical protein [Deltaproteobacteria bacterium]
MTIKVDNTAVQNFNILDRFSNKANVRNLFEPPAGEDTVTISDEAKKKHIMGHLIASFNGDDPSKKPY